MNKTVGIISIVSGILLLVIPRFILSVCEYHGHPAMHCSDTARAEYIAGALLIVNGAVALFLKRPAAVLAAAAVGVFISYASFSLPDVYGFCKNPNMPCNYGTVPAIRFIAVVTGVILLFTTIRLFQSIKKKGPPP